MIDKKNNSKYSLELKSCECRSLKPMCINYTDENPIKKLIDFIVYGWNLYQEIESYVKKFPTYPRQVIECTTRTQFIKIKREWLIAKQILAIGQMDILKCIKYLDSCKAAQFLLNNYQGDPEVEACFKFWITIRSKYANLIDKFLQSMNLETIKALKDHITYCNKEVKIFSKKYNVDCRIIINGGKRWLVS